MSWRLKKFNIRETILYSKKRVPGTEPLDQYKGSIEFSNKEEESFSINLSKSEMEEILSIISSKIVDKASELQSKMVKSFGEEIDEVISLEEQVKSLITENAPILGYSSKIHDYISIDIESNSGDKPKVKICLSASPIKIKRIKWGVFKNKIGKVFVESQLNYEISERVL
jgi:hypothetical protein